MELWENGGFDSIQCKKVIITFNKYYTQYSAHIIKRLMEMWENMFSVQYKTVIISMHFAVALFYWELTIIKVIFKNTYFHTKSKFHSRFRFPVRAASIHPILSTSMNQFHLNLPSVLSFSGFNSKHRHSPGLVRSGKRLGPLQILSGADLRRVSLLLTAWGVQFSA